MVAGGRFTNIRIAPTVPGKFKMELSRTELPQFEDALMKGLTFTWQEVEAKIEFFRWAWHGYVWLSNMKEAIRQ